MTSRSRRPRGFYTRTLAPSRMATPLLLAMVVWWNVRQHDKKTIKKSFGYSPAVRGGFIHSGFHLEHPLIQARHLLDIATMPLVRRAQTPQLPPRPPVRPPAPIPVGTAVFPLQLKCLVLVLGYDYE